MKKILYILIVILTVSCSKNSSEIQNITNIKMEQDVLKEIKLSSFGFIDSLKAIEINGFQIFGEVKVAKWLNKKIVLHTASPNTISILNNNGKVVNQIKPDHIINDITSIDIVRNKIYLLDRPLSKFYILDETLTIESRFTIPFFSQSFKVLNDSIVVFYTGNEKTPQNNGKLVFYNLLNSEVLNDLLPISELQRKYFNFLTKYHFDNFNNEIIFWDSSINTIFAVKDNKIVPMINLDYGDSGVPINFYKKAQFDNPYDFVTQMRKKGYAFRHFKLLSNKNYILIVFEKGGEYYTSVYNNKEKTTKTFNDIDDDIIFHYQLSDIKLSYFVNLYDENSFISFVPFEFVEESLADRHSSNKVIVEAADKKQNMLLFGKLK